MWQQYQQHLPQLTTLSDTHLAPGARHIKDAQNAADSPAERPHWGWKHTKSQQPTLKQKLLQARVFSFNQEASISLMGALVRGAVTPQLWWETWSSKSSVESFDLCLPHIVAGYTVQNWGNINLAEWLSSAGWHFDFHAWFFSTGSQTAADERDTCEILQRSVKSLKLHNCRQF